jgi:uncharacterized cupin superfamily protein
MNRVFAARRYITVPDGTEVSAFLNATDLTQDVPWGALGDMSIAAGRIAPGRRSWVHMHPIVTVVTYVVRGQLSIRLKPMEEKHYCELSLSTQQAAVAEPATLVQLLNHGDVDAEVLYIASPSYVFETEGDHVVYDDAVLVAESWEEAAEGNYHRAAALFNRRDAKRLREEAIHRLGRKRNAESSGSG